MSVKIYTGVRFIDSNMEVLLGNLVKERERWTRKVYDRLADFYVRKGIGIGTVTDFLDEVEKRKKEFVKFYELDVAIFPFEGKIYGMLFYDNFELPPFGLKNVKYEDFSYWDNTDRPDTISAADWEERRRVWGALLLDGKTGVPAHYGYLYSIYSADYFNEFVFYDILMSRVNNKKEV